MSLDISRAELEPLRDTGCLALTERTLAEMGDMLALAASTDPGD